MAIILYRRFAEVSYLAASVSVATQPVYLAVAYTVAAILAAPVRWIAAQAAVPVATAEVVVDNQESQTFW